MISINETKSKFYTIFYENISTYTIMQSYIELLFYQEPNFTEKILDLINESISKYPKTTKIKDIMDDVYLPSLFGRITLRGFGKISHENFQNYNNRNFIQFFYTEFEYYLFKCLKYIYMKKPEILSDKQVKIKLILESGLNLDTIIQAKIDLVIEQQLHENFSKFFDYIHKQLGLECNLNNDEIKGLIEFRQLRNLYAHGDGTITQMYLDKVSKSNLKLGKKVNLTRNTLNRFIILVISVLNNFDKSFINKYPEIIQD